MADFNDIGISRELDLPRIAKLLTIGFISGLLVFVGDWMLGYGVPDPEVSDFLPGFMSTYLKISDFRMVTAGVLGLIGITLETLSYFGIYRLIVCKSPDMAHNYRTGIIGMLAFGAGGVHVPCCAIAWIYKHVYAIDPSAALDITLSFTKYFVLPATILFLIFFILTSVVQIKAFVKGMTPLPKWCWVFCLPVGMLIAQVPGIFSSAAWVKALSCAWISVGDLWMCGGLLLMVRKLEKSGYQMPKES